MAYPRNLRNFGTFIDGKKETGKVVSGTFSGAKLMTGDQRANFDAKIKRDTGLELSETKVVLEEHNSYIYKLFGNRAQIDFLPTDSDVDHSARGWKYSIYGLVTEVQPNELKTGDDIPLNLTISPEWIKVWHEGELLWHFDPQAYIRIVGGQDQLEAQRRAMGF